MCVIKFFLQWILIDRVSNLFDLEFAPDWWRRGLVTQLGLPYPPWDKATEFAIRTLLCQGPCYELHEVPKGVDTT